MDYRVRLRNPTAPTVHRRLADLIGSGAIVLDHDDLVITVHDQAAMVGVLNALHELGCPIDAVTAVP